MAEFFERIDAVNAVADRAPGFVWRLQTESGNATEIDAFDDEWLIVNLSVWESPDALRAFTYDGAHADVMRKRREWFHAHADAHLVLWWIPAGHIPTTDEAKTRLHHLQTHGESAQAFTFKKIFEPQALLS